MVEASSGQAVSDSTVTVMTSPSLAALGLVELSELICSVRPGSVAFTSILVSRETLLVVKLVSAALL